MSVKKRDRAMQRLVRERQEKTGESYQAAWQQLAEQDEPALQQEAREASRHVNRIPLPFSTGKKVLPGQSAQITACPQLSAFWPDRFLVKNADRWEIRRLSLGLGKSPWSSLIEKEDRSRNASVFSLDTWQPLLQREVVSETIVTVATYTGPNEQGESFEAVLFGWDGEPPAKVSVHGAPDPSARISERAESKIVRANEMAVLPITIASPALFVDRFTIADAKDWIVHDIRTHGKSIFVQGGDLPGEMFTGSVPVILKPLAAKDRVEIAATYVGKNDVTSLKVELSGMSRPTSAGSDVSYFLPMSTDIPIIPTQSAQITGAPARDFIPDRLVITDADAWIINDIKVGNRSQMAQSGDIPGQAFSIQAVGCNVTLDRIPKAVDFAIVTTYDERGKQEGSGFFCGVQGRLVQEH